MLNYISFSVPNSKQHFNFILNCSEIVYNVKCVQRLIIMQWFRDHYAIGFFNFIFQVLSVSCWYAFFVQKFVH